MMSSTPVRLLSLVIVAMVVLLGVRGIVGGVSGGGDLLASADRSKHTAGGKRTVGVVAYVLDGDTVEVTTRDGSAIRVRFLGISAPEIPHPGKPGECYGHRSTRHLKQLLPPGTPVTLVTDPTQNDTDAYGRQLRYIHAAGRDIGKAQIRAGAAAGRDNSDPVSRATDYARTEDQAHKSEAGMWRACR